MLVELAEVVRGHLRKSDLAARMGGDEFAVLMAETNAAEAKSSAGSFGRLPAIPSRQAVFAVVR